MVNKQSRDINKFANIFGSKKGRVKIEKHFPTYFEGVKWDKTPNKVSRIIYLLESNKSDINELQYIIQEILSIHDGWKDKVETINNIINSIGLTINTESYAVEVLPISSKTAVETVPVSPDLSFKYDVALSFAGEDRDYVEKVAHLLKAKGVKSFYDQFEIANLWGKDLYTNLDQIYRTQARYCVLFLSKHYAAKAWTNHERESAQARAFNERQEYILPARFDDTEIPGIRPTIGYIDLRSSTPEQLVDLILQKLLKYR